MNKVYILFLLIGVSHALKKKELDDALERYDSAYLGKSIEIKRTLKAAYDHFIQQLISKIKSLKIEVAYKFNPFVQSTYRAIQREVNIEQSVRRANELALNNTVKTTDTEIIKCVDEEFQDAQVLLEDKFNITLDESNKNLDREKNAVRKLCEKNDPECFGFNLFMEIQEGENTFFENKKAAFKTYGDALLQNLSQDLNICFRNIQTNLFNKLKAIENSLKKVM